MAPRMCYAGVRLRDQRRECAIRTYWPEGLNFVWRGVIDDVCIYDRSLSETEIRSLYAVEK